MSPRGESILELMRQVLAVGASLDPAEAEIVYRVVLDHVRARPQRDEMLIVLHEHVGECTEPELRILLRYASVLERGRDWTGGLNLADPRIAAIAALADLLAAGDP